MSRGFAGSCLQCFAALLGFLAVSLLVGRLAPPFVPLVTPKTEFFTAHKDSIDTLFVGSSRIFHGISPKLFDVTLHEAGYHSHSFNAGVDAMVAPESVRLVRRFIALKPGKLKRVFLEITAIQPVPLHPGKVMLREVYWQDAGALRFAGRKFTGELREGKPFFEALGGFLVYAKLFAEHETSFGRFVDVAAPNPTDILGPDEDGFFPLSSPMSREQLANYHASMEQNAKGIAPPPMDPVNEAEYARLAHDLAKKHISLVFIGAPTPNVNLVTAGIDCPPGSPLFLFNDPAKFPSLFEDDNRLDVEHVNAKGATIFSRLLAQRFVAHLKTTAR